MIIANRLSVGDGNVGIFEKSNGVGGRLATRRTEAARFDHGAQFYRLKAPMENLHARWTEKSLATLWFETNGISHFKCVSGMTAFAKELASGLDIRRETRVNRIQEHSHGWILKCENAVECLAQCVIVTTPLPQALDLLKKSDVCYDQALDKIEYEKAIVALVEMENRGNSPLFDCGYHEVSEGVIFSVADQYAKGLSPVPALTVTLKPEASASLFDKTDESLVEFFSSELRRQYPKLVVEKMQIKRWRYSHPRRQFTSLYSSPAPNLHLAGDAFGGPSLNGAARSANAISDHLLMLATR